jgi:hypothetical protein
MNLKYTGAGFLPGVPARDLNANEVGTHGGAQALIASGLYVEDKPAAGKKAEKVSE